MDTSLFPVVFFLFVVIMAVSFYWLIVNDRREANKREADKMDADQKEADKTRLFLERKATLDSFSNAMGEFIKELERINYHGILLLEAPDIRNDYRFIDATAALAYQEVGMLLSDEYLGPPHGLTLMEPTVPPSLPVLPSWTIFDPLDSSRLAENHRLALMAYQAALLKVYESASVALEQRRMEMQDVADTRREAFERVKQGIGISIKLDDPNLLKDISELSIRMHFLPDCLKRPSNVSIDLQRRIALCDIEIPDLSRIPIMNMRPNTYGLRWTPVSKTQRRKAVEDIICSICIRAAYLTAMSDVGDAFDIVAVNAKQCWVDAATGLPREGIIASLQVASEELLQIQLAQVEPKVCFRHLNGLMTASVDQVTPIRPIFVLDTLDARVVESRDVASHLGLEANLAVMPWEDFEQLVRQLFEWEFGRNGVEVKVTRASRDRGVDAIMFDPDPLRGGKFVLQAKRYTRTVDVAAVRDLFGTVMNEGANRGILFTTSRYGPDSYEFAKDKPLSLVDGPNLIAMLKRHGRDFRIDLAEARRKEADERTI